MKMRGGLLALLVLGIATILMVFFVLPRLGGNKEATPEAAAPTTTPVAKPAETAAPATDPAAVTAAASAKMARLAQNAEAAIKSLSDLFADAKVPTVEAFANARASAETALTALSETDLPDGIDKAAADTISKARAGASRALGLLKALPADVNAAADAIKGLALALSGAEAPAGTDTAANPPAATTPAAEQKPAAPTETATPAAPVPAAPAAPAANTDTAAVELPKFDVLRVEPDGSTVIAGSAPAGTKVEIVDGDKVLSTTDVGPTGDFAAVLDNPLPPGNYAIALRSVDGKGASVTSEEIATISVPEKAQGQLLAMITKPGEASRVVTMPENVNTADKQQRVAATEEPAAAPATPELPQASALLSSSAPAIPVEPAPAATPSTAAPASAPAAETPAAIKVTAVEIEGDKIFIAGTAPPASSVRAYADENLVGEASTDNNSHFVVEGRVDLTVGNHTIRVDLLDATGQVSVRASVPFDRPAGEQVAVVAAGGTDGNSLVPLDQGAFDRQRDALSKAFAILKGLYADGKKPTLDALAAARSATEIALKSLSEFRPSSDLAPGIAERLAKTAADAGKAFTTLQAVPRDIDAVGAALPQITAMIDGVLNGTMPAEAAPAPASAGATAPAAATTAPGEPKTIAQAPLTASRDSVIIRQGDTLWQISRRVYGQGVRYTTIYLANEDQITNPDKIEPGQIFNVPGEALPNAEELHRRRMRGEAIE